LILITYTKPLSKLIGHFEKFPGIGPRTAQRFALFILNQPESTLRDFSNCFKNINWDNKNEKLIPIN